MFIMLWKAHLTTWAVVRVLDDSIKLSVTHIDGYRLKGKVCLWSAVVLFFRVTRCGKVHTKFKSGGKSFKLYGRGCITPAECNNAKTTVLKACEDAKAAGADADCEISCCSGDLCNAGVTPVVSGLLILSCALVALFRWARTVLLASKHDGIEIRALRDFLLVSYMKKGVNSLVRRHSRI